MQEGQGRQHRQPEQVVDDGNKNSYAKKYQCRQSLQVHDRVCERPDFENTLGIGA